MITQNMFAAFRPKGRLIPLALGGLLLCGLSGKVLLPSSSRVSNHATSSVPPAKAIRPDAVVLACPGRVEAATELVNVSAGIDGVLKAVLVREGQQVQAGDTLALLDCDDLAADFKVAHAAAESARQSYQRLIRGSREEERHLAADQRAEALATLQQVSLQEQRIQRLYHSGDVSRESLEIAKRELGVAEARLNAATNRQALVEALPLPEELAKADAEIRMAEEHGKTIAAKLNRCKVKAPLSGTVVRAHLKAGETVSTVFPQPIVSISDLSRLRVRAEVDERDVGRIYLGQPVIVSAAAFSEETFTGWVSSLGALMGRKKIYTGDPAEKSDRDVLEILVDLNQVDPRLVVGLRTTVQFLAR